MARAAGFDADPRPNLDAALASIERPARVLVFGSLYLAGVALGANGSLPD
jgi:hypothetical protein